MKINLDNWNLDIVPTIFICVTFPMFLYFAYWLLITGVIGALRMLKSRNWKPTKGRIIDTEIRYTIFDADDSLSVNFVLVKTYSYTINGISHTSNQNLASDSLYLNEYKQMSEFPRQYGDYRLNPDYKAAKEKEKGLIGEPITVYYNPQDYKEACLDNSFEKQIFLTIFMGLLFGSFITYLSYYFLSMIIEC